MKTFEDKKGRKYEFSITIGTVKRVKSLLGIDITDLSEEGFITTIANSPVDLVNMFWVLLQNQAQNISWTENGEAKTGVSEEEFGEGFAGDAIDDATVAFSEALTDFFPKAKRGLTRKLFAKTNSLVEAGFKEAEAEIEKIDTDLMVKEAFQESDSLG